MTRKRLRYSELGVPAPATVAATVPEPAAVAPPPIVVPERPRRNSTPVELARTLTAARAAAQPAHSLADAHLSRASGPSAR